MATEAEKAPPAVEALGGEQVIEGSNYDVLRKRLTASGEVLGARADSLNQRRQALFGTHPLAITGNERILTKHNCMPQDIVSLGGRLMLGYNVFLGMKSQTAVGDVFSLYAFERKDGGLVLEEVAEDRPDNFLNQQGFLRDFHDLYEYYRDARLLQLRRKEAMLLAVFQTGLTLKDIKVLRWAVDVQGRCTYIDNSGMGDHTFPPPHDFDWTPTERKHHIMGKHPHITIEDEVFVETVGGDLTLKVEDNTEDGLGLYREPVVDPYQSLGDADISYAMLGKLILLRVKPYREETVRYLVFSTLTRSVKRIDAMGQACLQLPEDHGVVFPGGYTLQDGETKTFDIDVEEMRFEEMVRAPNGEDVLYVFHQPKKGFYVLLAYNVIRKEMQTPIICQGFSRFSDGTMIVFKALGEVPTRVHPMQVWESPFMSDEHAAAAPQDGSYLAKVGNAELVRGISDALSVQRLISKLEPSVQVYETLISSSTRVMDSYFWLGHGEAGDMLSLLRTIRSTAGLILGEFEKVQALTKQAKEALVGAEAKQREILARLSHERWTEINPFVQGLGALRGQRGVLITLKEMRYIDAPRVEALEAEVMERYDILSKATVAFLQDEAALESYRASISVQAEAVTGLERVIQAEEVKGKLEGIGGGLDLLTEIVGGLQVGDAVARTRILENIADVLSLLNRGRATLEIRRRSLLEREGKAEFGAQFKLFGQSVTSALSLADTPEKCEEQLTRLMVQLEDLESRFSDFDAFLGELAAKREEVYEVFESRKQALVEDRQRRAQNMAQAGERILKGILRRAQNMASINELNSFFASDAMIFKVRELSGKLRDLGDAVKADDVESQLKTTRDQALRSLRDKLDLFEGGEGVIRLGKHRFTVNNQALELTLVPHGEEVAIHMAGTDFIEPVNDPEFSKLRGFWEQRLVSETAEVYRGEYLAASVFLDGEAGREGLSLQGLREAMLAEGGLLQVIRRYIESRYDEGYDRGVHDADAALILERVVALHSTAGVLRYRPEARSVACLFWAFGAEGKRRDQWVRRARSLGVLRESFDYGHPLEGLGRELAEAIGVFIEGHGFEASDLDRADGGQYLAEELAVERPCFITTAEAAGLRDAFLADLDGSGLKRRFDDDFRALEKDIISLHGLVRGWLEGYLERQGQAPSPALTDAVALMLTEGKLDRQVSAAAITAEITGMLGQHPRLPNQTLNLRLDEFLTRLRAYREGHVPQYLAYRKISRELLERERRALRLEELKPQVLSTFVRNTLIDQAYLPLIGGNLAKQIGSLEAEGSSARMGLLLVISPPGYGKTTLMEYVTSRLGLAFVKVNGPALGHGVTSLDPQEAPNATARQEVERINLALKMGNNVMLYLDDIQHTNPELLQKFISLCDAQRRIEGIWRGVTRTYDLRGKRFCVCMAGNPYTESGERFRIPDMLANRADTYNLGDILEGRQEAFARSYIENALTANAVLAPMATRDMKDVDLLIRKARGEEVSFNELTHSYSSVEIHEIIEVLKKLFRVQEVLLKVNQTYIASASQDDAYRTEPPFKLQGSYRNMNKLAEKVASAMNDEELERLVDDHYLGESQTLTTEAEHNLLKLAELRGRMSPAQLARWEEIKREFGRRKMLGGRDDDPVARVAGPLSVLVQKMDDIRSALRDEGLEAQLGGIREALVNVASRPSEGMGQGPAGLSDMLSRMEAGFRALGEARLEVQVINQTPPLVQETLARQIDIIEWTLIPLVRTMAQDLQMGRKVGGQLDGVVEQLKALEKALSLPEAVNRQGATLRDIVQGRGDPEGAA